MSNLHSVWVSNLHLRILVYSQRFVTTTSNAKRSVTLPNDGKCDLNSQRFRVSIELGNSANRARFVGGRSRGPMLIFERILALFRRSKPGRVAPGSLRPLGSLPPNAPRISGGSDLCTVSPCAARRPSQGRGSGSGSARSELLSECDKHALVVLARRNMMSEDDCHILKAKGYSGEALLVPAWKDVKRDLYQDKVSRDGIAKLEKLVAQSNASRSGACSTSPPHHAPPPR